ncbi:MAG: DUF2157 domain-containing protein [Bacteroidota bacterium]
MTKPTIQRFLIHTISRYSNWSAESINQFFHTQRIYADQRSWRDFIRLLLVGGGVAFLVSGIIFFFAYNWAAMHKFIKLGLVQGVLILLVLASIFLKIDTRIKNMVLTGAAMLVGAVFAVFGQIYQTGADAYDLFLGWTLFIALWAVIANFPPLWFIFLGLINLTIGLYAAQVAADWSYHLVANTLFVVNMVSLGLLKWQEGKPFVNTVPKWLERIIVIFAVGYITMSFCQGIFEKGDRTVWYFSILLSVLTYVGGIVYGKKVKDSFYVAVVGLSMIIVTTCMLIRLTRETFDIGLFLIVSVFLVASISWLVVQILALNKKWYG